MRLSELLRTLPTVISRVATGQRNKLLKNVELAKAYQKFPEKFSHFHINDPGFLQEDGPASGLVTSGIQYCNVAVLTLKDVLGKKIIYTWHIDHSPKAMKRFAKEMDELQKSNDFSNAKMEICRRNLTSVSGNLEVWGLSIQSQIEEIAHSHGIKPSYKTISSPNLLIMPTGEIHGILSPYRLFMCRQTLNLFHFFLGENEFREVENKKITQHAAPEPEGEERKESAQGTKSAAESSAFLPSLSPSAVEVQTHSHQPQPTARVGGRGG